MYQRRWITALVAVTAVLALTGAGCDGSGGGSPTAPGKTFKARDLGGELPPPKVRDPDLADQNPTIKAHLDGRDGQVSVETTGSRDSVFRFTLPNVPTNPEGGFGHEVYAIDNAHYDGNNQESVVVAEGICIEQPKDGRCVELKVIKGTAWFRYCSDGTISPGQVRCSAR